MDATVDDFLAEIDAIVPPPKAAINTTNLNPTNSNLNLNKQQQHASTKQTKSHKEKEKNKQEQQKGQNNQQKQQKDEEICDWQECFDDQSGFIYYWNVRTDKVTWEIPKEYEEYKKRLKSNKNIINKNDITTTTNKTTKKQKEGLDINRKTKDGSCTKDERIVLISSSYGNDTEDEEEEEDKESEEEQEKGQEQTKDKTKQQRQQQENNATTKRKIIKIENDDKNAANTVENPKIQCLNAKKQKAERIINKGGREQRQDGAAVVVKSTGISLLMAEYDSCSDSDGDDDEEEQEKKDANVHAKQQSDSEKNSSNSLFPIIQQAPSLSSCNINTTVNAGHSTLFPIQETIDVKQFQNKSTEQFNCNSNNCSSSSNKLSLSLDDGSSNLRQFSHKRKRKLDIGNIMNVSSSSSKKVVELGNVKMNAEEQQRLEQIVEDNVEEKKKSFKPLIAFVKTDVLIPSSSSSASENNESSSVFSLSLKDIEDTQILLREKLSFLAGREEVLSPVQTIIVQLDTLRQALSEKALTASYFNTWLREKNEELIQLEKAAAPEQWLLQWDRSNKRYFYSHKETGKCQWEYPTSSTSTSTSNSTLTTNVEIKGNASLPMNLMNQDDVNDDAMDICTTPPPQELVIEGNNDNENNTTTNEDNSNSSNASQQANAAKKESGGVGNDSLTSVLDSFYSDIAALESNKLPPSVTSSTTITTGTTMAAQQENSENNILTSTSKMTATTTTMTTNLPASSSTTTSSSSTTSLNQDTQLQQQQQQKQENKASSSTTKKKKVKLTQGLSMKKKGVSKLVEKWKNVQNSY